MHSQDASTSRLMRRAIDLSLSVDNVLEGRRTGLLSDDKALEMFSKLADSNEDLVLREQQDQELKDFIRSVRVILLPFSKRKFAY